MASPTPEQEANFDRFISAYRIVLREKASPMGSPSRNALMNLGDAASAWGRSMGFDDKVSNSIQYGLYLEGSNRR